MQCCQQGAIQAANILMNPLTWMAVLALATTVVGKAKRKVNK